NTTTLTGLIAAISPVVVDGAAEDCQCASAVVDPASVAMIEEVTSIVTADDAVSDREVCFTMNAATSIPGRVLTNCAASGRCRPTLVDATATESGRVTTDGAIDYLQWSVAGNATANALRSAIAAAHVPIDDAVA